MKKSKKYFGIIGAMALAAVILGGCGQAQGQSKMAYIGADAAKKAVLEQVGLTADQVKITGVDMATKNGMDYYHIEFSDEQGNAYRYDIEALTGKVIESAETSAAETTEPVATAAAETTAAASTTAAGSGTGSEASGGTNAGTQAANQTTAAAGNNGATGGAAITAEQAKAKALEHAGLTADGVTFIRAELDWDDGKRVYDVDFYGSDGTEYDYEIDAGSGAVISVDKDMERRQQAAAGGGTGAGASGGANAGTQAANQTTAAAGNSGAAGGGSGAGVTGGAAITAEQAKAKALEHAGLTADGVTFIRAELDWDDGKRVYDVDFYGSDGTEYDYEIDAGSGAVISVDKDMERRQQAAAGGGTGSGASGGANAGTQAAPPATAAAGNSGTTGGGSGAGATGGAAITAEQAKAKALEHAGLTADGVTFIRAELDWDDGKRVYDVDFYGSDGTEYDYEIDAGSGAVISVDKDMERRQQTAAGGGTGSGASGGANAGTQAANQTTAAAGNSGATSGGSGAGATGGAAITAEQAKAKALEHAGLTADGVTFIRAELDWDDGKRVYDVDFYGSDGTEYDYEIDAGSGAVISVDKDMERRQQTAAGGGSGAGATGGANAGTPAPPPTTAAAENGGAALTADAAKQMALAQVPGATLNDIREFETDRDDGRLEYEGTIYYGGMEYEFEIDAYSGAFRKWESDRDDYDDHHDDHDDHDDYDDYYDD